MISREDPKNLEATGLHTVDDINPAVPIIRNIYHNSYSFGPLR